MRRWAEVLDADERSVATGASSGDAAGPPNMCIVEEAFAVVDDVE